MEDLNVNLSKELAREYVSLFASARITNDGAVKWAADRAQRNWARYEAVEKRTGVPAFIIACLHCLEASFDFGSHLHNGDPLSERTWQVPAGRPKAPPANGRTYTWEESAADALAYDGALNIEPWDVANALHFLEGFNGWGYRTGAGRGTTPPMRSPYLWSMTNHYNRGKYVADGKWDGNAVSAQVGCCALIVAMKARGLPVFELASNSPEIPDGSNEPIPTEPTGRLYSPAPVPLPFPRTLRMGDQGIDVYVLQCALVGLGFLRAPTKDEFIGDLFNEVVDFAVTRYQEEVMNENADGVVGPNTKAALEKSLRLARGEPPVANGVMTLRRTGKTRSDGLEQLVLDYGQSFKIECVSGARGVQRFLKPGHPDSRPGSLQPIPQGAYTVGTPEWAGGRGNWNDSFGPGLGPVWIAITATFNDDRSAFGFHLDENYATSPGSAGCVVFTQRTHLERFLALFNDPRLRPRKLEVNWNL